MRIGTPQLTYHFGSISKATIKVLAQELVGLESLFNDVDSFSFSFLQDEFPYLSSKISTGI